MNSGVEVDDATALWDAYRRTAYIAVINGQALNIRVDLMTLGLDAELARRGVTTWAFMTAWNPGSHLLSPAENEARQLKLREELVRGGFDVAEGQGVPPDDGWTREASVLVFGIRASEALAIGARQGQLPIVVGQLCGTAQLVACCKAAWSGE